VRTAVGINEIHNFGKYAVTGPEAETWLSHIMANRMPNEGRMVLTPMLSPKGRLVGDFTVSKLSNEEFHLTASSVAQAYHMRWFQDHLPDNGVEVRNVSLERIGFQIAGPKARELLQRVTRSDVSNEAFPFLSVRRLNVGLVPAMVCRVTYTGDLGYEIYVAARHQVALYHALAEAGEDLGLRPFGMRAMLSLRLEKSFGSWMREYKPDYTPAEREYKPDYTPAETGLDRFVSFKKNDFIGRDAALAAKETPPSRRLCTFVVDALDADVWADEPIWKDGEVVGFVTSGGYAHHAEKSVALGFVPPDMIAEGAEFEIEILGEMRPATLVTEPLFDPKGERMRG
jgi:dimethylglycine dehydrogenase